jgi:quercetin dioxygenase-like cupin family protein
MPFYDLNTIKPVQSTTDHLRQVVASENFAITRIVVRQCWNTQLHRHGHDRIIIVLKGIWHFRLPEREVTLRPNQMLVIPAGVEYRSDVIEDTEALEIAVHKDTDPTSEDMDQLPQDDSDQYLWGI